MWLTALFFSTLLGKHPNIVEAKQVKTHNGIPLIVLEYVEGVSLYGSNLSGWIHNGGLYQNGKPDLPLILEFAIQFCHGMIHAEKKFKEMGLPFVHRDIKPPNIMVTRDQVVKVTDFGLVKAFAELDGNFSSIILDGSGNRNLDFSKSGSIIGTPPYMSPEQCRGEKNIDTRSDIYAFGCVLYEMVTRRLIFEGKTINEFIRHHLSTRPISTGVWTRLDAVIMKCLEKKPANRFLNFRELEAILSRLYGMLTGEEIKKPETKHLSWQELNNKGLSLLNLGLKEEAISCFTEALRTNPNEAEIHANLGDAYKTQGRMDEALAEYQKAAKIYPDDTMIHRNLAEIYHSRGMLDEVISEHKEIIRIRPDDWLAYMEMGIIYQTQGKLDEALTEFLTLHKISPNASSHHWIGGVLAEQGNLNEAVKQYQQAIKLEPNGFCYHHSLGNVYKTLGKLDEAAREYQEELKLNPHYQFLHFELGEVYQAQGKLDDAVREYQLELKINQYAFNHLTLGKAYKAQGKLDEAILEYKQAIEIASEKGYDYAEAHSVLGGAYQAQGKIGEAIRAYREVLRIDPNHDNNPGTLPAMKVSAHHNLALVLEIAGKHSEALQQWRIYIEVAREAPDEKNGIIEAQQHIKELEKMLR